MDINRALQWFEEGSYDQILRTSKQLFPNHDALPADWRRLLAYSYQKTGQFESAMEHWNVLSVAHPEDAYIYLERGVCKFNLRFKHAMDDFDYALELQPENAYFHSAKAYVLDKLGRISEAVHHYEIAIRLDPENEITLNNLAVTEQKRGNQSKAEEWMRLTDELLRSKGISLPVPESTPAPQPMPSTQERIDPSIPASRWGEVKKMLSSRAEFVKFLKEAGSLLKKK